MLFLMGVLALLLTTPNANADDKEKYKLFAEETRKEVWALKLPEFTNTAVPDKYKDESAVILAAHSRLEITKKTRFNVGAFLGGFHYIDREVNCRDLYRMLVQINDKAALKEFSEFDYKAEIRKKDWRYDENYQQVLGVRIIKPDGTVNEISTDEYMTATEGKKDQEQLQKLAVPGLEIGDIIDLFFVRYTILNNQNPEPFGFYFMDSYPLLAYSVHCEIDPKLSTFYRCLNGARDFDHSTDTEGNHILDLHTGDSGRVIPDFWYNSARQTPMILMYIYNSKTPYAWMPPSARKPGLYANPNPKLMTDDTRASMKAPGTNWSGLRSGRKGEISKALKARQAEGWSDKKLMDYLYQYCYYRYMENGADYTPASFILLMHELLEKAGIPHRTGITTKDTREPLDQLINYSNTTWFIYLESNGKCYTPPACYAVPGEVPASLQGEEAILEDNTCLTLPSTTPQDNRDMATINASISGTTLHISRREEMSGALKEHFQPYLIMDEDLYNSVRRQLGITATIYDETKEKFHADLRESYRREREQEKERYHNEIIGYHGSEEGLETLLGYQLFSIGNRADSAALVYQVDYVLDGYVKKAGTNFVLSVGRLIGSQPELKGEQRLRKEDIYWEMPRCYQWDITVNLPEGYRISPEGLERLNVKVENDCGAFIVQATTEDGTLRIKAEKRINHKTEPVANWEKLLEITDAANSYEALSIVFQATINPPTSPTTGY